MEKIEKDDIKKVENKRKNNNVQIGQDTQISQETQIFQFVKEKNYMKNNIEKTKDNSYKVVNEDKKNNEKNIEKNIEKVEQKNNEIIHKKIEVIKKENNIEENSSKNKIVEDKNKENNTSNKTDKVPNYNNYQEKNKPQNYNNYQEKNMSSNNSTKKVLTVLLLLILVILVVIIFSIIFSLMNANNKNIIQGVYINNIDVSNLSENEAMEILEQKLNDNKKNYIIVKYNNYTRNIKLQDINGKFNIEDAVNNACNIGKDKDIIQNNYKILSTMIFKNKIEANFTYDEELLQKMINEISLEIPGMAINSSYIIDGHNLIIKNGTEGLKIQESTFTKDLIKAFSSDTKEFEIKTEQCNRKEIDIEKIYKEVYKKPINAYYTTNPHEIHKEETGVDFAITLQEAKNILSENKEEYIIPLKKIQPQIKVSDLDADAFPDLLSTFTTKYGTGDVNRNINIALAAKSINSVVLMPGETFSYNDLIGECSTKTGYKAATIYMNGELSTGIGGGICQVSTTLYNTVLRANLEIVERRNHSLGVTYVPSGQDAMVSIGTQDFKFKNNREYPIKVVAYVGTGSVTCQIYGLKQDTEYEVKLYSRTISKTDKKYKVETYKILCLNGAEVSRTWLSTDTYKYH